MLFFEGMLIGILIKNICCIILCNLLVENYSLSAGVYVQGEEELEAGLGLLKE